MPKTYKVDSARLDTLVLDTALFCRLVRHHDFIFLFGFQTKGVKMQKLDTYCKSSESPYNTGYTKLEWGNILGGGGLFGTMSNNISILALPCH